MRSTTPNAATALSVTQAPNKQPTVHFSSISNFFQAKVKHLPYILAVCLALASLGAFGRSGRKTSQPTSADLAKADYIYLEALRWLGSDRRAEGFELLKRANELNPADHEIGLELAMPYLQISEGDDSMVEKGMGYLRAYRDHNPSDYYSGVQYALLSARLGHLDDALLTWGILHRTDPANDAVTSRYADALGRTALPDSVAKAIAIYDSIEAIAGSDMELTSHKLQLYYRVNDTTAIFSEMQRLRESNPNDVEYIISTADLCMMFDRKDEALKFYNQAIATDSTSGHAVYARANYYKETGDTLSYGHEVMRALSMENLELPAKMTILHEYVSNTYSDSTLHPQIRNLFEGLVVTHPAEADLHNMYGRFLAATHDYQGATEQLEVSLGLEPDNADGWDVLCRLYFQTDNYKPLEKALANAIHYFPDNADFRMMESMMYALTERREDALKSLEKTVELTDPSATDKLSDIYCSMGDNLYSLGRTDSASVYYEKSILYNPDNYNALNNAAYHIAEAGGDLDRALKMIEKAVATDENNTTWLDTYAWVLFKKKDFDKAREIMDRVIELDTEAGSLSEEVLHHAGDIYFMDGDPAGALRYWKEALEKDPDNDLLQRKVKHKTYFYE